MKKITQTVFSAIMILVLSLAAFGQPPISSTKSSDTILLKIEERLLELNNKLISVSFQLRQADTIQINTLSEVTKDTFWKDVKTNVVASFVYDLLGFNGYTTGSILAKILSFLYLIYICIKARYWWKAGRFKNSDNPVLDFFGGIITCLQAAFSLFVFFASFFFSNNEILDKAAFNETNRNIQILNKQIEKIKDVDFVALSDNLKLVQQLKIDTLHSIDISYLIRLESKITESNLLISSQLNSLAQKVDSIWKEINSTAPPSNIAKRGWQIFQTILLFLITIVLFVFVYDDFERKGYI